MIIWFVVFIVIFVIVIADEITFIEGAVIVISLTFSLIASIISIVCLWRIVTFAAIILLTVS